MKLTELQELNIKNWGNANKSDPFAEDVARAHYQNGICNDSADYEVIKVEENGKEVFKRMKRP